MMLILPITQTIDQCYGLSDTAWWLRCERGPSHQDGLQVILPHVGSRLSRATVLSARSRLFAGHHGAISSLSWRCAYDNCCDPTRTARLDRIQKPAALIDQCRSFISSTDKHRRVAASSTRCRSKTETELKYSSHPEHLQRTPVSILVGALTWHRLRWAG
jgi:hypothetical protein